MASSSRRWWFWIRASRFEFFTGVIAPTLVGCAVAYDDSGRLHLGLALLTLLGLLFLHAAANLANDYFDHLSGNDALNRTFIRPFTGGSRVIQQGLARPREVLVASLLSLGLGALLGFILVWLRGLPILVLGLVGGLTGFFYTAPPLKLGYRGLGEIFLALDFGVLPVLGAYYVQTQHFSLAALWASLPVALLILAVLWINQFPDYDADRAVGKCHWVVRLGRRRAAWVYCGMVTGSYACVLIAVAAQILPPLSLLVALSLPLAAKGMNVALAEYDTPARLAPANAATVGLHLTFNLLLTLGLVVDRLLR
ncbi:MAG TPA: 1,4-dihydroxy-2-naphthoate octaprenyltransferase [Armatimonadota bacterium]|jgi:1,4-dihydroxy-2-naphthoate octaprenyltransferase